MSLLIQYLVKLSISLAIVWLFYQFILRKITFYNSNRWYLLAYTLLSFFIPFINISTILGNNSGANNGLIQFIPSVHQYTIALEEASHCPVPIWSTSYDKWDWTAFALMIGAGILLLRFIVRYISFSRIRNRSKLISTDGIKIYQVDESIIPFSFGKSVFINSNLHTEDELREIVRHEFVHVRQNHTIDIIWAELLCIINWYNPFAWLLKRSIRQNLEFIADSKVVENGIDKKQYQYLLLKVIGNNQYSIATKFNFSSLKKRIAMMNKTKSARLQVGRFLFLVPVLAIILLAFRRSFNDSPSAKPNTQSFILTDTIPDVTTPNSKGFYIDIKDNKGNCMVVIKDKNKQEVKRLLLTEWNEKSGYYENLYGEILSPIKLEIEKTIKASNPDVRTVTVKNNIATVTLNNGKKEVYTLSLSPEKKAFENKYCFPNSALIQTESLQKVKVEGEVESLAEIREEPIKEVRVVDLEEIEVVEAPITVTGVKSTVSPTSTKSELVEVTVVGKKSISPTKTTTLVATTKPEIEEVTVVGKPTKAITGNIVEVPIGGTLQEKRIIHLGGLTILDEGQYILLDGKEVNPSSYGKLTGPYKITFVDKSEAEKKYGTKAKNGAIILGTIR
ncbi:MAG TPA: M56 family metallopeptidase [Chitinophagaceae bacterium]